MGNAQLQQGVADDASPDILVSGTTLMLGRYTIETFLNAGGFGITYAARDPLGRRITIKECFPAQFSRREGTFLRARTPQHQQTLDSLVRQFVEEARNLSKLRHTNVHSLRDIFEENGTAYMALRFVEGRDLLDIIEDPDAQLWPAEVRHCLRSLLGALDYIHGQGILHRDIAPDNILIDEQGMPILIDFGAAREHITGQGRVLSALRVVKDGYSPQEFYAAGREQGPSSDLYALAASFHHLIANEAPPGSQDRLAALAEGEADPYRPLVGRFKTYPEPFLAAIDKALALASKDRFQSAQAWLDMMEQTTATPVVAAPRAVAKVAKTGVRRPMRTALFGALGVVGLGLVLAAPLVTRSLQGEPTVPASAPVTASPLPEVELTLSQTTALATPEPVVQTQIDTIQPVVSLPRPLAAPVAPTAAELGWAVLDEAPIEWESTLDMAALIAAERERYAASQVVAEPVAQPSTGPRPLARATVRDMFSATGIPAAELPMYVEPTADAAGRLPLRSPLASQADRGRQMFKPRNRPFIKRTALASGFAIETPTTQRGAATRITSLPKTYTGELRVGDIIRGTVDAEGNIRTRPTLHDILNRNRGDENEILDLAITRGDETWLVPQSLRGIVTQLEE